MISLAYRRRGRILFASLPPPSYNHRCPPRGENYPMAGLTDRGGLRFLGRLESIPVRRLQFPIRQKRSTLPLNRKRLLEDQLPADSN